jgi:hypothetical protein
MIYLVKDVARLGCILSMLEFEWRVKMNEILLRHNSSRAPERNSE